MQIVKADLFAHPMPVIRKATENYQNENLIAKKNSKNVNSFSFIMSAR